MSVIKNLAQIKANFSFAADLPHSQRRMEFTNTTAVSSKNLADKSLMSRNRYCSFLQITVTKRAIYSPKSFVFQLNAIPALDLDQFQQKIQNIRNANKNGVIAPSSLVSKRSPENGHEATAKKFKGDEGE
jgi:hypothetical protein